MRGHVWSASITSLIWASAFASCADRHEVDRDAGNEPLRLRDGGGLADAGAPEVRVRGIVVDVRGNRIAAASVAVGTSYARSDSDGEFELPDLPAQDAVSLNVAVWGYSTARVPVRLDVTRTPYIKVVLQRAELVELLDPILGGQVRTNGGTVLELPREGIADANGELVRAPVTISVALIDDRDEMAAAPESAIAIDSSAASSGFSALESFGMVEVQMTSRGERVDLRSGSEATLSFPMAANHPFGPGDAVSLWQLQDASDMWATAGYGVVDEANRLTATVPHFSYWAAGQTLTTACAVGRVVDTTGAPIAALDIAAEGRSYLGHTRTGTNAAGEFCLEAGVSSVIELSALLRTEDIDRVLALRLDMPSASGDCTRPDSCYALPQALVAVVPHKRLCDPVQCPIAPPGSEACCLTDLGPCSIVIHGDCSGSEDGAWDLPPMDPGVQEIPGVPLGLSPSMLPDAGTTDRAPVMDASVGGTALDARVAPDARAPDARAPDADDHDGGELHDGAPGSVVCAALDADAGQQCDDENLDAGFFL